MRFQVLEAGTIDEDVVGFLQDLFRVHPLRDNDDDVVLPHLPPEGRDDMCASDTGHSGIERLDDDSPPFGIMVVEDYIRHIHRRHTRSAYPDSEDLAPVAMSNAVAHQPFTDGGLQLASNLMSRGRFKP